MKRQNLLVAICVAMALSGCSMHGNSGLFGSRGHHNNPYAYQPVYMYQPVAYDCEQPQYMPALYPGDPFAGRRQKVKKNRRHPHNVYQATPVAAGGWMTGANYFQPAMYPGPMMPVGGMWSTAGDVCGCDDSAEYVPVSMGSPAMFSYGAVHGQEAMMSGSEFSAGCFSQGMPMDPACAAPTCAAPMMMAPTCAAPVTDPSCAIPAMQTPGGAFPQMSMPAAGQHFAPQEPQEQVFPAPVPDSAPMQDDIAPMPPAVEKTSWIVPQSNAQGGVPMPGQRVMSRQMLPAPGVIR